MNRDTSPKRGSNSSKLRFGTFSYKNSALITSTWIRVDCRDLANPYYMPEMTSLTGKDDAVYNFVRTRKREMFDALVEDVKGKIRARDVSQQYNIAFGCTGGKHRSVAMCRHIQAWCKEEGIDYTTLGRLN